MNVIQTTKTFLKLSILRAKPSDVPYSKALLTLVSIVFLLTKSASYMWFIRIADRFDTDQVFQLDAVGAFLVSLIWLLFLFASLRTTLSYYKMPDRFDQIATSIVGVECLLSLVFFAFLGALSLLEIPQEFKTYGMVGIIIGFVVIMYWEFMVYIHILVNGMDISIVKAGIFALVYMLLQNNLSEIVLNSLVTILNLKG